ncbi:MAG TPA: DUF4062 domain-containing protein, partial [Bacteroidia bacterium]|nr:DUF4062 domain-containing protein [Bacteroidia bacterium]
MDTSSEYTFPIFISSTDYNLKDLRAELARFLSELGYRPILSSADGFPDSSPKLEPWESCLPVLDNCFVMTLIIDGRYGATLNWPNFRESFKERDLSPTHAEYCFAHQIGKRMLVFIRKDLMPLYQTYRTALKKSNNDIDKTKEILSNTLPDNVSYETLEFIHEVKTTRPIPWIKEFNDITDIKKEIQKKMLNELAELFLIKNKRIEIITDAFNKAMFSLTAEEQKKVLSTIDATKEFIDTFDKIEDYKQQIKTTEEELQKVKKISATEKTASEEKIKELKKELTKAEKTVNSSFNDFFIQNGHVQIGNYTGNLNSFSPVKAVAGGIYGTAIKTCS